MIFFNKLFILYAIWATIMAGHSTLQILNGLLSKIFYILQKLYKS